MVVPHNHANRLVSTPEPIAAHAGSGSFQNNVAQRLRGDQLYSQLVSALGITEVSSAGAAFSRGPYGRDPRAQFNAVFGYDPSVAAMR